MPRFFFHFTDGKRTFPDPIGVELNGIAAARATLLSQLCELKGALGEHRIQDWSEWTIVVEDEKKKRLLEMGFDLELRYSTKATL
jgi:hypothetical protein